MVQGVNEALEQGARLNARAEELFRQLLGEPGIEGEPDDMGYLMAVTASLYAAAIAEKARRDGFKPGQGLPFEVLGGLMHHLQIGFAYYLAHPIRMEAPDAQT